MKLYSACHPDLRRVCSFRREGILCALLFLLLCLGSLAVPRAALAQQTGDAWTVRQIATAPDGTTRELWVKAGTGSGSSYTGDQATVWTLDASGKMTSEGVIYGGYQGWHVGQLAVAPDGTSRLLWVNFGTGSGPTYTGDQATVWTLDATGRETSGRIVYGPYQGWHVFQVVGASDDTSRLLWYKNGTGSGSSYTGDYATVWTLDASGKMTSEGVIYGGYQGWQVSHVAVAPDGTSRLLWVNSVMDSTGQAAIVWTLDSIGQETSGGTILGPYDGVQVYQITTAPDNSSRLLWVKAGTGGAGDQVAIWALNAMGQVTSMSAVYGPYGGALVFRMAVAPDGTSRLLWVKTGTGGGANYTGDQIVVWTLDASGQMTSGGILYGPYVGCHISQIAASPDGTSRLLWVKSGTTDNNGNYTGDATAVWSLDATGQTTHEGIVYGPFL